MPGTAGTTGKRAAALRPIYSAASAEAAAVALTAFEAGVWGQRFPTIGKMWRRAWTEVIPFFAFPVHCWRAAMNPFAILYDDRFAKTLV